MWKQLLLILFILTSSFIAAQKSPQTASQTIEKTHSNLELISVQRIWDQAEHCAFTDLFEFQGALYCTFREADEHAGGIDGVIRVLKSEDGLEWTPVAILAKEGIDLRDPKLSTLPDGRLLMTLGGMVFEKGERKGGDCYVAFSEDGINWSEVQCLDMPEEWIWRLTWHNGIGYGISYSGLYADPADPEQSWGLMLYQTQDGLNYDRITQIKVPNFPSEATLRFMPDNTMVAMLRRQGKGWIGTAQPPYEDWSWKATTTYFGGQNFLILPEGQMWGTSRYLVIEGNEIVETQTAVGPMTLDDFHPDLILPSGGDTSYPGMVYRDGILYVSYYSSHEGKTSIYLAQILIEQ
jgi:hypothetical protein